MSSNGRRSVQIGIGNKGTPKGVCWGKDGAAWGAVACDEEGGLLKPCRFVVKQRPRHRPGPARRCPPLLTFCQTLARERYHPSEDVYAIRNACISWNATERIMPHVRGYHHSAW